MTKENEIQDEGCLESFDYLYTYLNGELKDEKALAQLEHHLSHCKSCYSRAQMERQLNEKMKGAGRKKAPAEVKNRLKGLLEDL